jgi:hypothetical protein
VSLQSNSTALASELNCSLIWARNFAGYHILKLTVGLWSARDFTGHFFLVGMAIFDQNASGMGAESRHLPGGFVLSTS